MTVVPFRHPARWYSRAFTAAARRTIRGFEDNRAPAHGADRVLYRFDKDVVGALGESALAAFLEVDWDGMAAYDYDGDVGDIQVRTTPYTNGSLPVYPTDDPDARFVLVTLDYSRCVAQMVGWIYGREAQAVPLSIKSRARGKGSEAHWIGQALLRPMEELDR